jgi:hypothetical protein
MTHANGAECRSTRPELTPRMERLPAPTRHPERRYSGTHGRRSPGSRSGRDPRPGAAALGSSPARGPGDRGGAGGRSGGRRQAAMGREPGLRVAVARPVVEAAVHAPGRSRRRPARAGCPPARRRPARPSAATHTRSAPGGGAATPTRSRSRPSRAGTSAERAAAACPSCSAPAELGRGQRALDRVLRAAVGRLARDAPVRERGTDLDDRARAAGARRPSPSRCSPTRRSGRAALDGRGRGGPANRRLAKGPPGEGSANPIGGGR